MLLKSEGGRGQGGEREAEGDGMERERGSELFLADS